MKDICLLWRSTRMPCRNTEAVAPNFDCHRSNMLTLLEENVQKTLLLENLLIAFIDHNMEGI